MAFEGGPYVQAACFCDLVIQDNTGVISLIRIIDTYNRQVVGPNPPRDMEAFMASLKFVLMLKSGEAQGRYDLKLVPHLPNGETEQPMVQSVHFEGEEKGLNFILDVRFTFRFEGLHWFRMYLDDQLLAAVPLRVRYNRVIAPITPTA